MQFHKQLIAIEGIVHEHPDSALQAIRQIPGEQLRTERQRALHALISSLAMDKCYIDIADDSIARIAVRYYANGRDCRRSMLSWYSLGRVQMNADNPGGAIVSLKQAEHEALALDDNHYLGLIYYNIGNLYGRQDDSKEALDYYTRSATCFNQSNEPGNAAYSQLYTALALFSMARYSDCDSLLLSLEKYAQSSEDAFLLSRLDFAKGSVVLLRDKSKAGYAKSLLRSGIDRGYGMRCQDLGYLMMACAYLEQRDSSDYYRTLALDNVRNSRDSALVFMAIYKVESYWNNYKEAIHYQDLSWQITNRRMNRRESMLISNSLADYHKTEAADAKERVQRQRYMTIVSVAALLLLLAFFIQQLQLRILLNREKDRIIADQGARLQEDIEKTGEILSTLKVLQTENSEAMSALFSSVLSQMEMVNKWADVYNDITKESPDPYRKLDADYYTRKEDAIRAFYSSLDGVRNDDKWYSRLEYLVNKSQDGIMARVRSACYQPGKKRQQMDESDYRTLLLMLVGLPDKTTAYFLGLSYGSVRMRRLRYKELFSHMDAPDGPILLNALAAARSMRIHTE